jgi:aryl carrier-like protein
MVAWLFFLRKEGLKMNYRKTFSRITLIAWCTIAVIFLMCSITLNNAQAKFLFKARIDYDAADGPSSVAIGDLNGDAKPDLAVANRRSNNVSVLLGNGDGSFQSAVNYGAVDGPKSVAIGDLNGDANPDLAVANDWSDNVSILINTRKEISVDINIYPKVLNLKSKGKRIISGIRLPEEYDPHDIARDSLELYIPSCSGCEVIYPTCGFPLWKRYLAFFPRQDLIDEIETMNLELPTKLDLKITGELDDGTPFEGLDTIRVIKRKKWTKRK